jgi:hypothetical protein
VSSMLREFYAAQGTALAREAHDLRRDHGPLPRDQAGSRSGGRHRRAKGRRSAARAAVFQAGTTEVTAPSGLAAMADIVKPGLLQPGQEPRSASRLMPMRASRLYMSTCGLTSRRRLLGALLAQSGWQLTKEARELPAAVRGAKRTNIPSMQRSTSHANSTAPPAGKRPTPRVNAASSRS